MEKNFLKICLVDLIGIKYPARDNKIHIEAGIEWLKKAQDVNKDGGVARWYSLLKGWGDSYIETTGYIIETFLNCSGYLNDKSLKDRAVKMADYLLTVQLENGGFITEKKEDKSPTVFDTGQVILGLLDIYLETNKKKYLDSAIRAADFLCEIQEKDGSWLKFTYGGVVHSYNTRVAWALLRIFQITKKEKYKIAAIKNLDWTISNQQANGWFKNANFPPPNPSSPFTHTISYTIEGLLYSYLILKKDKYLISAKKAADKLLSIYSESDIIPATLDQNWKSSDKYSCLTGDAQISIVWINLYKITGESKYSTFAKRMNNFLKGTQMTLSKDIIDGAMKGSLPIFGEILPNFGAYSRFAYLCWATKFFIDALLLEESL